MLFHTNGKSMVRAHFGSYFSHLCSILKSTVIRLIDGTEDAFIVGLLTPLFMNLSSLRFD